MAEDWTHDQIAAWIDEEERKYKNIPRGLSKAVAYHESGYDPYIQGDSGNSVGVFQLQKKAAIDAGLDPKERYDPRRNIQGGVNYLSQKLAQSKGNVDEALSRYNRGTPDYRGIGDPNYIARVKRYYQPEGESGQPQARLASQTVEAKPWWDKFVPRFGPRSAEAAEPSKWDTMFPGKPPSAAPQEPAATAASAQAETPAASRWDAMFPGTPPASPLASPTGAPAQTSMPTQPAEGTTAPAPAWKVSFDDPQRPQPPTAASTPEQAAAYRANVGQGQPPEPTQNPQTEQLPPSTTPTPSAEEMRGVAPGTTLPIPPADAPLEETISRAPFEWMATGIEMGSGVAGTVAGGAVGGIPGAVAGGIAGQGYGTRLNKQLGLRPQEDYIATAGYGLTLYPSDVLNASLGLLTGGPALFKSALAKTTAGKAIVEAEMTTKQAYQAWQAERQRVQAAQKTGQQAELNTALKDHATAEANYRRLAQQRNETVAANKAEYDQAVQEYQTTANQAYVKDVDAKQSYLNDLAERQRKQYGTVRAETEQELLASREAGYNKTLDQIKKEQAAYETKVGAESRMWESQAAAIPEAQAIPKPLEAGTPYHVLYKEMRDLYSDAPLTLDAGKADLQALRANRPKTLAGTPSPFEGEVETIAQGLEKATGANVATIHEELKKLGPLTRHGDGKIRGDAKQVAGILMDVLETAPEAAGAIKAANTAFKRQMSIDDMNDWLKPGHGVISSRRGKDIINPDNFLKKFNKEMADSTLFRDSFTPEEAATIRSSMEALAAKTLPAPPLRAPTPPTPELLPGASPPPPAPAEALPAAAYPERFTKGLAGAPERTQLPPAPELAAPPQEVPPLYPEFPKPGKPGGLTVPLEPPAKIPPEPASTSMWYPDPRKQGEWRRRAVPDEGQWTREQWETFAKAKLGDKPGIFKPLAGALGGAGAMAYGLQRMGLSPAAANVALWGSGITGAVIGGHKNLNWLLSRSLLSDKYRPLVQEALSPGNQINPYFANAMIAVLTPEDRKEYERMQRSQEQQKKARR